MASEIVKPILKNYGKKLVQNAIVGYTGYQIGEVFDEDEIIVRPNITVSVPNIHKGEFLSDSNTTIIILLCIVIGLIALLFGKNLLIKFIQRQVINNSQAIELQATSTSRRTRGVDINV